MINLNAEEMQLAACYEKTERLAWMQNIIKDTDMDKEVRPVAMSLVDKVSRMTDKEWNMIEFTVEEGA